MKNLYILITFLFIVVLGFGQVTTIDFETAGNLYTPSTTFGSGITDVFNRTNTPNNGNSTNYWAAEDISGNPSIALDQIDITGSTSFTFSVDFSYPNAGKWDSADELIITYSTDGGMTYSNLMAVQHINSDAYNNPAAIDSDFDGNGDLGSELSTSVFNTFTTPSITLNSNTTLDIKFQFNVLTSGGEGIFIDNIVITEVGGTPTPTITSSKTSLANFDYVADYGPSVEQSFTVEGSNLTADISIAAPTNYEISTTTGGSFVATNPITLTQSGGDVSTTTIYTRLKTGLSIGAYNSEDIICTSTDATDKTISCDGTVNSPDAPTGFTAIASSTSQIDLSWSKNTNSNDVIIVYDTDNSFTDPADGITYSGFTLGGTVIYQGSSTSYNHTSLSSGTQYYYQAYSVDANDNYSVLVSDDATTLEPTITQSETTLSGFSYSLGNGPSTEQSFTVEGSNLTADILITPTTNYEISTNTGGAFSATNLITLIQSSGNVASTTIYVRLKSGLTEASYNSENIISTSTGATNKNASCSGSVFTPPTTTLPYNDINNSDTYSVSGDSKVWGISSGVASMNGYNSGDTEEDWLILSGINFDSYSNEEMTFNSEYQYGSNDANNYIKLLYSSNYSGIGDPSSSTWTELSFTIPSSATTQTASGTIDLSSITGTNVYIAFKYRYEAGSYRRWTIDNIEITENSGLPDPTITQSETTLSGFSYILGDGPSTEQSFTIEGSNLTNNISIVPPTNYEISTTTGGSFSATNPITLTQSGGNVAVTTIYTRLKANLSLNDYNSENIIISTTGITDKNISCSGSVARPDAPTAFSTSVISFSQIDLVWTKNSNIDDVIIVFNEDNSFSTPVDGTPYSVSATALGGTIIYNGGGTSFSHTSLTSSTHYYYQAYSVDANNNYSALVSDGATTSSNCIASSLPFNEGFESGVPPACWTSFKGSNSLGDNAEWVTSNESNTGSSSAHVAYDNVIGGNAEDWLVTPELDLSSRSNVEMIFYHKQAYSGSYGTIYTIRVSTASQTTYDDFAIIKTYTETDFDDAFSKETIDLSAYDGQSIYIAFVMEQDDGDEWFIDDINIAELAVTSEPTNHVSAFSVTAASTSNDEITLTWSDNDGAQAADNFLIKASTVSLADITNPSDGNPEVDGALIKNITHGIETATFTSLSESTTYYFKIYPYTNSSSNIDFKTDGSIPQVSETTEAAPTIPDLIISEVADPADANGRFIELYNGSGSTIDFSTHTFYLSRQANGSGWDDNILTGTVAVGSTHLIVYNSSNFRSVFSGVIEDQVSGAVITGNGDDAYFLYYGGDHLTGTLIDQFGVINTDGTGELWEYTNGVAMRNTSVQPGDGKAAHTFDISQWTINKGVDIGFMTPGNKVAGQTLPIDLISFSASANTNSMNVNWKTATEINNDYFTIERSYNAIDFKDIAEVKGAGNSNKLISYDYDDVDAETNKTIYYRLKQTDFDGKFTLSEIISVNSTSDNFSLVYSYGYEGDIYLNMNSAINSNALIEVLDISGRILFSNHINLQEGINSYKINIPNYTSGLYFVRIANKKYKQIINAKLILK